MEVSRIRALRGPNLWSRHTCDRGDRRLQPTTKRAIERPARLRSTGCARCSRPSATLQPGRPRRSRCRWRMCSRTAAAARCRRRPAARSPSAAPRATIETGIYQVVVEYSEEAVGRLAFELAAGADRRRAATDTAFDLDAALDRAARPRRRRAPRARAPARSCDAAVARGIPYRRLTEGSLVQFGWGSKQRRIQAAEIDSTSAIAESIAQDKELTKQLLRRRRRAGAAGRAGERRRRRLGRRAGDRPAGGGQAAGRQPGQGRHGQHHDARAADAGLRRRPPSSATT